MSEKMDDDQFAHMLKLSTVYIPILKSRCLFEDLREMDSSEEHNALNCLEIVADTFVEMQRRLGQDAIDLEEYRLDVERLRAALERAEGGFYNMANAIDDYDYHGPAPQCTGDIIGHREQFHRAHVEQLVKYAEECRAALSGDKHDS